MKAKYTKVIQYTHGGVTTAHWENENGDKIILKKAPKNYNIKKFENNN